jgi:hypothetical protein
MGINSFYIKKIPHTTGILFLMCQRNFTAGSVHVAQLITFTMEYARSEWPVPKIAFKDPHFFVTF